MRVQSLFGVLQCHCPFVDPLFAELSTVQLHTKCRCSANSRETLYRPIHLTGRRNCCVSSFYFRMINKHKNLFIFVIKNTLWEIYGKTGLRLFNAITTL